jgi:FkbM family methyltransferase
MDLLYQVYKFKNQIVLAVLGFLYKKKTIRQARINDYKILVDLKDGIGKQIYGLKRYEKRYTDVLKKIIKNDWICADVGANIGYYSLLLAKLAPQGKVYAIEPNEELCGMIKASAALNDFKNIEVINQAVGNENAVKTFYLSGDSGFSSLKNIDSAQKNVQVRETKLDDLLDKVDFIKIDTEGTAKDVVLGMAGILKNSRPKAIQIEISLDDEIIGLFKSFNYRGYYIVKTGVLGKINGQFPKNVDYYFISGEYEKDFLGSGFLIA